MGSTVAPTRARPVELLVTLVERQLRVRAKRAVFGVVWPLVVPLFLLALYTLVFQRVFDVPVRRYPVYLYAGLLPWSFLTQSLGQALTSISAEAELVRRVRFPYEMLPAATVLSMACYFVAGLGGFVAWLGATGSLRWSLLPVLALPVASLLLLVLALAMVVALVDVYNRDLRQVLGNLFTVWFFLVPIVYRQEMAPSWLHWLRRADPMNLIVGQFRGVLVFGHIARPDHTVLMVLVCASLFAVCLAVFRRFAPELPKDV
jgi:ABC-type polysaccharide/polyol phosphate export permease